MGNDFESMAREREEEAAKLTDLDVWKSVVEKAVILDSEPFIKADILLQSISDIGVIFAQLKVQNRKGNIPDQEYHDLLEIILEKLESDMQIHEFNPLKYKEE